MLFSPLAKSVDGVPNDGERGLKLTLLDLPDYAGSSAPP